MRGQAGFWNVDERYAQLSEAGDPLEKLNSFVPWDLFRKPLSKALKRSDGLKGGRPAYDPERMFKVLVLQALYSLSDDQAEFQIQNRLSFMRFLCVDWATRLPDSKTIWLFREHRVLAGAIENLFARFDRHLSKAGYLATGGQIYPLSELYLIKVKCSQSPASASFLSKLYTICDLLLPPLAMGVSGFAELPYILMV